MPIHSPPDWKEDIPYTLDSVARYSYQNPTQQEELKLPVSRYGSNKNKHLAANGTSKSCCTGYLRSVKKKTKLIRVNSSKYKLSRIALTQGLSLSRFT